MQITSVDTIPIPRPHGFVVLNGSHASAIQMLKISAQLSVIGPVRILDCGNRCNAYYLAKELRTITDDPVAAMNRIRLSRAFTCYQTETLLAHNRLLSNIPILIFDLLSTFLDESVSTGEAKRLMMDTVGHLKYLSRKNPVIVGVKPLHSICTERLFLLEMIKTSADEVYQEAEESSLMETPQIRLF
jgi:hypothetical protein